MFIELDTYFAEKLMRYAGFQALHAPVVELKAKES
jgi:hypothetical protein